MFARRYAVKAVKAPNPELIKVYPVLCERRSVHQTVLRSAAMDCSLLEFRILASALARNSSIQCKIIPSQFYLLHTDCYRSSRFEIVYPPTEIFVKC